MLSLLARASLEGALLALVVWLACRAMPRLSPAVRALLWWCVAAKFVVALLPVAPIGVPVLPSAPLPREVISAVTPEAGGATMPSSSRTVAPERANRTSLVASAGEPARRNGPGLPWTAILVSLWALGLGVSLTRTLRSWKETRGVVSRSQAGSAPLHEVVRELSALLGLRRIADVRASSEIESPLITGIRRPVILVPTHSFALLSAEQQRMALCHELAHMKRGDLWLGCIPAVVERCFFFHPVARLAAREYAFWREAACDEAVLQSLGASPQSYGRLLLALGVSRPQATFSAAGAAWSFSNLKRRITMLGHSSSTTFGARMAGTAVAALAIIAVAPVKAVARTAAPAAAAYYPSPVTMTEFEESASAGLVQQDSTMAHVARQHPSTHAGQHARTQVELQARQKQHAQQLHHAQTKQAIEAQHARQAQQAQQSHQSHQSQQSQQAQHALTAQRAATERHEARAHDEVTGQHATIAQTAASGQQERGSQQDLRFVYFSDDRNTTMSGSSGDVSRARQYRRSGEPLLWFRRDGQEYIVRDEKVLREVEELWAPVSRVGQEQGKVGAKQGEIGAEQGRHGAQQGKVGAKLGVLGARQGVIGAQLGLLSARESEGVSASERREIEREREKLERDMRQLEVEMRAVNDEMRNVAPPSRRLGEDMEKLGREMEVLGAQMETASKRANAGMRTLMERAVRSGAAEAVR
ncbi:MAG: M56 family metallopeptidase [Gemmatimonadota bacterium]